jgi:hypothetical protein
MQTFVCPNGCCNIYTKADIYTKTFQHSIKKNYNKAGVFIYDSNLDKVLLVQSNGNLWGPPKGTIKYAESERQCAVREVREETGLVISSDDFLRALNIHNKAIYFYLEKNECEVSIPDGISDNDATGITWIKPKCLEKCIINGNITLSKHCCLVFNKFMNKVFPPSNFILVKKKKSKTF